MKKKIIVVILILTIVILLAVSIFFIVKYVSSKNKETKKSNVSALIVGGEKSQNDKTVDDKKEKIIQYTDTIYFYDIKDVKFQFESYPFKLRERLESREVRIDDVLEKVQKDEKDGTIQTLTFVDGRSKLYMYDKFFVLVVYSSTTNRNIYIGKPNIEILKKHKKEKEQKICEFAYSVYFRNTNDIEFELEGQKMKLRENLKNGEIHIDDVIEQAEKDEKDGKIRVLPVMDGGSKLYIYDNFTIFKEHSPSGGRDVIIKSKN